MSGGTKMPTRLAIDGGTPVITQSIPSGMHGPSVIDEREVNAVTEVLRSGKLFRFVENSNVASFEADAAAHLGVKHALMVNSGTSALVCALTGVGVGPGDEVVLPGYTFIATAAAIVGVGAIPVIAEIDDSLGLDVADVERKITPHTKAILPVHMQGVPCRLKALVELARKHNLKIVEDCCQCVGGKYKGKYAGSWGDAGAWSLNYYKIISCGEGGLVFTNDYDVYERSAFAAEPGLPMWMSDAEWKNKPFSRQCYRTSEILGAIARVQLSKLEDILAHTRRLKKAFVAELAEQPKGYIRQHIDDTSGECGISAAIIVHDNELAKAYADALKAEGLNAGTAYNQGFPDRHIYTYWDSILFKHSPHPAGYPWNDARYTGNVEYSSDMCPQTLSILGRALRFSFNVNMQEEHARLMAAAINKVDDVLG